MGKESQEIAKNIKCDWCGFLVEDIWETIIGAPTTAPLLPCVSVRLPARIAVFYR